MPSSDHLITLLSFSKRELQGGNDESAEDDQPYLRLRDFLLKKRNCIGVGGNVGQGQTCCYPSYGFRGGQMYCTGKMGR